MRARLMPACDHRDLLAVRMVARDRAYAVGRGGALLRRDHAGWASVTNVVGEDLYAVTAAGDDIYAVGGNLDVGGHSLVVHGRGDGPWRATRSPIQSVLLAVAADDRGGAVRAVGFNGGAIERAGDGWREIAAGTHQHLFGLAALRDGGWVACGLAGTIAWIATDGSARVERICDDHLTSVAVADDAVFAAGFAGALLRHDASGWTPVDVPVRSNLWSVCCAAAGVVAVGAGGTILHGDRGASAFAAVPSPTTAALHGVHGCGDLAIAVGAGGAVVEVTGLS